METKNPIVEIQMKNGGKMAIELFPDQAPATVANFVDLVQRGFYSGLQFHRVIQGFVIQGGSRSGDCAGEDLGFTIKGEFTANGHQNNVKHVRGAISMARSSMPNSASTQFFVCHQDTPSLDREYAAFGVMIEGFDTLDEIAATPTRSSAEENRPLEPQIMEKVTLRANGYSAAEPERIGEIQL